MANYDNISGVSYTRYQDGDDTDDPTTSQQDAELKELYFHNGRLHISMDTADGFLDIVIPVLSAEKWNKFVNSLPLWRFVDPDDAE